MSEPIDTGHSLDQPTLPEAMFIEDLALAAVAIVGDFVPGVTPLENAINDAVQVWKKDAPPIERVVATLLGVISKRVGPENLRKMLDGETIQLANQAADLAEDLKFGPEKT